MKNNILKVVTKIGLLSAIVLATAVVSTQAQSLEYRIRVNIPFDFTIRDKKLPAGEYSIGRARVNSDDTILSILDEDGHTKQLRASIPVETFDAKNKATLVFHRYGDQYFLYQVWSAGETTGRQFPKSSAEREILRNLATDAASGKVSQNTQVETVTVAGVLQ